MVMYEKTTKNYLDVPLSCAHVTLQQHLLVNHLRGRAGNRFIIPNPTHSRDMWSENGPPKWHNNPSFSSLSFCKQTQEIYSSTSFLEFETR